MDGGACGVGLESTIIGFEDGAPVLLRAGGLAVEEVERVLNRPVLAHAGGINAPGQLLSHYAPNARLRLNAENIESGEALIGFGNVEGAAVNLSPDGNLTEAAARLFAALHEMDARAEAIADKIETGTVFMNRADYLDPALCWTGCKDTGRGGGLSIIGYHNLTRPKSYHLKKA